MSTVTINNLKFGMVVKYNVISQSGKIIIGEDRTIDEQAINRLKFYRIGEIIINDDYEYPDAPAAMLDDDTGSAEIVFDRATNHVYLPKSDSGKAIHIEQETYNDMKEQLKSSPTAHLHKMPERETNDFRQRKGYKKLLAGYSASLKATRNIFSRIKDGENVSDSEFSSVIDGAFNMENGSFSLFEWFNIIRDLNDPIYAQGINAALLCKALGKWLGFDHADCNTLAVCGLLHDIGKLTIDPAILNKPGELTDDEFNTIRSHTMAGFDMVKNLEIDPRVKKSILQHHERNDGSGYPFHRIQEEIHPFAQVTAICDVYIAMTSGRSHRKSLCPFDVMHELEKTGMAQFNGRYLFTFLENIATAYQKNTIILNDGRCGSIVMLNRNNYSNPVIQLEDDTFIDLSQTPELYITGIK